MSLSELEINALIRGTEEDKKPLWERRDTENREDETEI